MIVFAVYSKIIIELISIISEEGFFEVLWQGMKIFFILMY